MKLTKQFMYTVGRGFNIKSLVEGQRIEPTTKSYRIRQKDLTQKMLEQLNIIQINY